MKLNKINKKSYKPLLAGLLLSCTLPPAALAGTHAAAAPAPEAPSKAAPLPLHQIEGNGGIFSTLCAFLVNPPREGELFGRPSFGASFIRFGHGRNFTAFTLTESPHDRVELGYAYNHFDLGDLPQALGGAISDSQVTQHNFNLRLNLLKDGDLGLDWLPHITLGAHFKYNPEISTINSELAGALSGIGIKRNHGIDYTLYASKLFSDLPLPVLVNVGARATKAAHIGLLGFTNSYSVQFEANVAVFLTKQFIIAAEYRGKPNKYTAIPGLIEREDSWWTIDLAYLVNDHFTIAGGYGHFGHVLNHKANAGWGLTLKYEL